MRTNCVLVSKLSLIFISNAAQLTITFTEKFHENNPPFSSPFRALPETNIILMVCYLLLFVFAKTLRIKNQLKCRDIFMFMKSFSIYEKQTLTLQRFFERRGKKKCKCFPIQSEDRYWSRKLCAHSALTSWHSIHQWWIWEGSARGANVLGAGLEGQQCRLPRTPSHHREQLASEQLKSSSLCQRGRPPPIFTPRLHSVMSSHSLHNFKMTRIIFLGNRKQNELKWH